MTILDLRDEDGYALIHEAALEGRDATIETCLRNGSDPNLTVQSVDEFNNYTPIILAIINGNIKTVVVLAQRGANLNISIQDKTPLMFAIQHSVFAVELVATLINMGADATTIRAEIEKDDIQAFTQWNVQEEFFQDLSNIFLNSSQNSNNAKTQHHKAYDIAKIIEFINNETVPEERKYTVNYFTYAAMEQPPDIKFMIALIQNKYDISRANANNETAYELTKTNNNLLSLMLLGAHADIADKINHIGEDGLNDVHRAIISGNHLILAALLASGGDANLPNGNKYFPLTLAMMSQNNMSRMFFILVNNGADFAQYSLQGIQDAIDLGFAHPNSKKAYLKASSGNPLSQKETDFMTLYSKEFWHKVAKLNPEKIDELIHKYTHREKISFEEILTNTQAPDDDASLHQESNMMGLSDQEDGYA